MQFTKKLLGWLAITILLLSYATASATENLIFSNEIYEINPAHTILNNNNETGDTILQFGATLNEQLLWDTDNGPGGDGAFVFTDDVVIQENLDIDGVIYAGSGGVQITNSQGQLDGEQIADDTIDVDSLDFGTGTDQISGVNLPVIDNFTNSNSTDVQNVLEDIDTALNSLDAPVNSTGTTSNTYTIDMDNTGGNVDLVFGESVGSYLRHNGTNFIISDNLELLGSISGSGWDIDNTGITTGLTIDGDTSTLQDIDFSSLKTRTKNIEVNMNDLTIIADGGSNKANLYNDSETNSGGHEYYLLKSRQTGLQDLDLKIKVLLPEDFVDFSSTSDLSFYYKNTGTDNTDSKIDILVEDDEGDDAYTATDGQNLFNTSWTEYTDEFDGGSFNPTAGEYIYITLKGYGSYDSGFQSPYLGELVIKYIGK